MSAVRLSTCKQCRVTYRSDSEKDKRNLAKCMEKQHKFTHENEQRGSSDSSSS
jgi:hypothetical protein